MRRKGRNGRQERIRTLEGLTKILNALFDNEINSQVNNPPPNNTMHTDLASFKVTMPDVFYPVRIQRGSVDFGKPITFCSNPINNSKNSITK